MSNFTDFHRLGKRGWVPIPCRAIKLGIFLTAKEAKIAKFLYPEAFSHLIADQSIWNEAQKNSEPLSFSLISLLSRLNQNSLCCFWGL
jgi:hypothetical protein